MMMRMRRRHGVVGLIGCGLLAASAGVGARAGEGGEPSAGRKLVVPEGFRVERVAGAPLVDRPITAAFDEQGRLYVADSSGSNEKVEIQLEKKPHRIVRLEDADGDGVYDKQVVFAEGMMFPEGTMWLDGSLYVAAPPSIWKLTDVDGDGVADERVEWFQGKTLTGCANDLHGPYPGHDGRIYWTKGAFAEQTYGRPGKEPFVTSASHIFRSRPDGSEIEPVLTGGMDNPVDVAFLPGGERVLSSTFLQQPGGGFRDGLIHAVYGGIYGKVNRVLDAPSHQWTGPGVMPALLHMGPAAPSGLMCVESTSLEPAGRDVLFACYFNLHKVGRHVLEPSGATFATKDEDFVTSPDLDFHPTDVIEDADGSLIVIDTGGWYKLCCPTSQLSKPDELGGIYRVRRKDAPHVADPYGRLVEWAKLPPADLAPLLCDPRPAVRRRAVDALGKLGAAATPTLIEVVEHDRIDVARRNAVWASARIDAPEARAVARIGLADGDETVRQAAANVVSLTRDPQAVAPLVALLEGPSPLNRRVAAEALGRIGDKAAISSLIQALDDVSAEDRFLHHALTYALIQLDDPEATAPSIESGNPRVRRAALMAVDQMEGGALDPRKTAAMLADADPGVKEAAAWIIGRHPEWGQALAGFFADRLKREDLDPADRAGLESQLARNAASPAVRDLLAETLVGSAPATARRSALKALAQVRQKGLPEAWIAGLAAILSGPDADLARQAVATARALAPTPDEGKPLTVPLMALAGREDFPADGRLEALAAVPGGLSRVAPETFAFLLTQLDPDGTVAARGLAADVLARAGLAPEQLAELVAALRDAGPLEVDRLLTAFDAQTDDALGVKLVEALSGSAALSSLRVDALKLHLAKFGPDTHRAAEALYNRLNADAAKQQARLDELLGKMTGGDVRRGQLVFQGDKAACTTCHAIGYRGGDLGPDLTRIGGVRTERDLLEAILYPSASLVRSYEPVIIATADGKVVNGLLRGETADEYVLLTGANQTERIPRADVDEIRPGTVSVMPAGLDQQLSPQDLADLVAFLKACK
ncbi:PVC-type heme-binding CxxCH protein [Planctomyces sp. SH-PL62]|uniref:PVC-type heme-binding CxxCH protein n=1 Tax=Planctomyces sp. SH-PL62 TaxID=1636152 RepID=UPI00078E94CA|nr:PVC-type heme-binding CxxCH protein [Planctomyces sp. SH-PL62]AMV40719.1 PBS lyase HEAT-like repeat protein [Planctomyces sp. SH-PL62]